MPENQGYEQAALDRIAVQWEPMAEAAANLMGMPPGGKRYSEQEQLEMWNASPIASPEERINTMIQLYGLGKTVEEITDAIYPQRRKIIEASHPSPDRRIRYAQDMVKAMEKQAAGLGMSLPSNEPQAALPVPEPMQQYGPEASPTAVAPFEKSAPAPSILDQPINLTMGG